MLAPPSNATLNHDASRPSRRSSGGITLDDVSKLAGVSAITVSRALNTPERVSPKTREKVRLAVERTGYVPNLLAGGLASNRSRLVAALVPTIAGPVFLETIQALTEALAEAGYQLMLGQAAGQQVRHVAGARHRQPDLLAGLGRHQLGRVQRPRDRDGGDAGELGDIVERDAAAAAAAGAGRSVGVVQGGVEWWR